MFRLFRSGAAEPASAASASKGPDHIARRSTALGEFSRLLNSSEPLYVLDLGPTSPRNISYLTGLGHRLYNEDVLAAANDPSLVSTGEDGQPRYDVDRFLAENLAFKDVFFDAVLCWDVPDYLPEPFVKPVVERLSDCMKTGGTLLGFFHNRDAGPNIPYYRYHITGKDELDLQKGGDFRLQRVFNNRHIENLFKDFASLKFFLARDHVREVLVLR